MHHFKSTVLQNGSHDFVRNLLPVVSYKEASFFIGFKEKHLSSHDFPAQIFRQTHHSLDIWDICRSGGILITSYIFEDLANGHAIFSANHSPNTTFKGYRGYLQVRRNPYKKLYFRGFSKRTSHLFCKSFAKHNTLGYRGYLQVRRNPYKKVYFQGFGKRTSHLFCTSFAKHNTLGYRG